MTLAYVSAAHALFARAELDELLLQCRRKNSERDVTGLLLYRGGNFLQVLEGEEAEVLALQGRIARDPRHTRMIVMLARPSERRQFGDWSMAFRNLDDPVLHATSGYSDLLNHDLTVPGIGGRLEPLIESFRRSMR